MATLSPISPTQEKEATPQDASIPDWKASILEKKRRAKEVELLLKEEEVLKIQSLPEWKLELMKRKGSFQKAPVFKMAAPPIPPSSPPKLDTPTSQQQEYPPLPAWIREKLSQVANQLKAEQKPQQNIEPVQDESKDVQRKTSIPHVVQNIVHKFSFVPPPLPSPSEVTPKNFSQITDSSADPSLMDDPSLATLPDWKRSIIVRRRRGQVLKRLSLTKDDLDMISSLQKNAAKSTPDKVDFQLQDMSDKRDSKDVETEMQRRAESSATDQVVPLASRKVAARLFVAQEPQRKVRELLDKFAPIPQTIPSVVLSPSVPKSMKIAKREFSRPPPAIPTTKKPVIPSQVKPKVEPPPIMPLSPERILTVEEYNRHHALLVQAIARQMGLPHIVNGNEGMFDFIIPETSPSKRPRTLSPETPISSVDNYKQITDISQPLYLPPRPRYEKSPEISESIHSTEKPLDSSLEDVTLSYIDEISDETIVPIHRPRSPDQDIMSVPWRETLEKIKLKRKERETSDLYENVVVVSSYDTPALKSSLKLPGVRSQRGHVCFSDKNPSVYQYPKMEVGEEDFGFGNMNSLMSNQEDLSHRLHPSIFTTRKQYQSDKLQNYTPAILDYFDSIASKPSQPVSAQGNETEEQGPTRDESDEVLDSFTAVPVDFEEELDMSNLSDRAAAMIW